MTFDKILYVWYQNVKTDINLFPDIRYLLRNNFSKNISIISIFVLYLYAQYAILRINANMYYFNIKKKRKKGNSSFKFFNKLIPFYFPLHKKNLI